MNRYYDDDRARDLWYEAQEEERRERGEPEPEEDPEEKAFRTIYQEPISYAEAIATFNAMKQNTKNAVDRIHLWLFLERQGFQLLEKDESFRNQMIVLLDKYLERSRTKPGSIPAEEHIRIWQLRYNLSIFLTFQEKRNK